MALAAVLRQVAEQAIHAGEVGAVNKMPAIALLADELGMHQLLEMEGQRGGTHFKLRSQITWRTALGPGDHQRAVDPQSHGLGQCREGADDVLFFHNSIMIE